MTTSAKIICALGLAALLMLPLAPTGAQNLIVNGDFAAPSNPANAGNGGCVGQSWTAWTLPATGSAVSFWYFGCPFDAHIQRLILGVVSGSASQYDGGIVQAVTTVPGTAYDLEMDLQLASNEGGIEAPIPKPNAFLIRGYFGYDLTGQTSDPAASTIVWSDHEKVWNSNTWAHYHARFQATGAAVSIWFKAHRYKSWGYLDIDNVVLKPAGATALINNYDPPQPSLGNPGLEDSNIALGPDATTATITWRTDVPSSGKIDYGSGEPTMPGGGDTGIVYEMSQEEAGPPVTEHTVTLTGLTANSAYHFRLVNSASGALTAYSRDYTLSTAPTETGIPNPTLTPWVPFGWVDHSGSNGGTGIFGPGASYGVSANEGKYFFGAFASYEAKSGGIYQKIKASPGASYSFTSDFFTYVAPNTHPTDDLVFIGIDPTGGTDYNAPTVVWNGDGRGPRCFDPQALDCGVGAYNDPVVPVWNRSSELGNGNRTEVQAVAQANTITVFVYFWQKWGLLFNMTGADRLQLLRTDPANVDSVGAARQEADSTVVSITSPQVVTLVPVSDTGFIYAQDPDGSAGIRVETAGTLPALGDSITIAGGLLATNANGERVLQNATITVTGGSETTPLRLVVNKSVGGKGYVDAGGLPAIAGLTNQGLLVKLFGKVTKVDYANDYFLIDDGSDVDAQDTARGVKVIRTGLLPLEGQYVSVIGVVSAEKINGKLVRVLRGREDFNELQILN